MTDANGNYYNFRVLLGQPSVLTGLKVLGNLDISSAVLFGNQNSEWASAIVSVNKQLTAGAANTPIVGTFVANNGKGAGAHLVAAANGTITNSTGAGINVQIGVQIYVYNAGQATPPVPLPGVLDTISINYLVNGDAANPVLVYNGTVSNSSISPTLITFSARLVGMANNAVISLVSTDTTTPANNLVFSYVSFVAQVVT